MTEPADGQRQPPELTANPASPPSPASPVPPPPARPAEPWFSRQELSLGLGIVGLLAGVGIVLGIVWHLWSRTPTAGLVYTSHSIVPDETEGFISSDGRFAVLTGAIGLLAGVLAWTRRAYRGPAIATALTVGGVLGAILTDVIGRLLGGGKDTGTLNTVLARLPLQVHAIGLVGLEAALALLAYLLPALFVTADDLGREPAAARPTVD